MERFRHPKRSQQRADSTRSLVQKQRRQSLLVATKSPTLVSTTLLCTWCIHRVQAALCMPPTAVLSGLLIVTAFCLSHAGISVPCNECMEPVLLWISIGMPTGSRKSPLYKFLLGLLRKARTKLRLDDQTPSRSTFRKDGSNDG